MRHRKGIKRNRARLALEPLEERAMPSIFTVTNLNDGGPGSLRQAISAANAAPDSDVITFASGLTGTINLTIPGSDDNNVGGDLDILNPVSIQGPGANLLIVRQTVLNERVFDIRPAAGASVSISGLTITGGNAAAGFGGGVYLPTAAVLTLSAVEIVGNTAQSEGGGVLAGVAGSVLAILNSTIAANSAEGSGAGIDIVGGSATISNSTISGNTARSSGSLGGGVGVFVGGNLAVRNSTIVGNTATTGAGMIWEGSATVSLSSTIVAGNNPAGAGDIVGTLKGGDHNLIGDGTGLMGVANGINGNLIGTAAIPISPLLGPLQFNGGPTRTHAPLPGSVAIGNGSDLVGLAADQRGIPFVRVAGAGVDIGAVEVQLSPPPTSQALQAAVQDIGILQSAGTHFAAVAFADVSGDSVSDIVLAFRQRNGRLMVVSCDGVDGHIQGAFTPVRAMLNPNARVQLVTLQFDPDAAFEIALLINQGGPGVPRLSIFDGTGARLL